MFEFISKAPTDPILGLLDFYKNDNNLNKVNLSIGVYQDETGNIPILECVKKAERYILENEISKNYLSISGTDDFIQQNQYLLFNNGKNFIVNKDYICSIQTPGGTSALRTAADFLVKNNVSKRIWISNPSWPNHIGIFSTAGLEICRYFYFDENKKNINFDNLIFDLNKARSGDVVLFHGCCHNPTGVDLNVNEWKELAKFLLEKNCLPLFDFAYQGFGNGLQEDREGIQIFCKYHKEMIICNSYSKNFGLYNERIGSCTVLASNATIINCIFSQLKYIVRTNYSNPPAHGALIISTILKDIHLSNLWEKELSNMRKRIKYMRKLFVTNLQNKTITKNFEFINNQNGMFSFVGLSKNQVLELRKKFNIYIVDSGRINIAGITHNNIDFLCNAIVSVL